MPLIAFTRAVSPSLADCELTHLERGALDWEKAARQHLAYERALHDLGCEIRHLPAEATLPDCVFVEDTAVVTDEFALVTRPGAPSRRPETQAMAAAMKGLRPLTFMTDPGTLDGGDVLKLGRTLYVGIGARTNAEGLRQLKQVAEPLGYGVRSVPQDKCLHLKTAVSEVAAGVLLYNPDWVEASHFPGFQLIAVDPSEPFAANGLIVGTTLVYGAHHPKTEARLRKRGLTLRLVDISELAKAEAGVTCCSVLISV